MTFNIAGSTAGSMAGGLAGRRAATARENRAGKVEDNAV
jgi:hypothetical protein